MHSAPVLALHCSASCSSCWCVQVRNCLTLNHGWAWVTSARKASSTCFRNISSESSFMTTYYICALVALRIMVRRTLMTRSVPVVDDIMFRFVRVWMCVHVYACVYMYTYTCLLRNRSRFKNVDEYVRRFRDVYGSTTTRSAHRKWRHTLLRSTLFDFTSAITVNGNLLMGMLIHRKSTCILS